MKYFSFVLWMIGYPFVRTMSVFVHQYLLKQEFAETTHIISGLIAFIIWACVGKIIFTNS